MKFKQNITWYKNNYLKNDWLIKKSNHYTFYYFKNSLAEKDIEEISKIKENHYKKILLYLNVQNYQKINYYLYPSLKVKQILMGDNSFGNVIWKNFSLIENKVTTKSFEIHVLYSSNVKFIGEHEDVHLLSLPLGLSVYIFNEGLAQFLEGDLLGKDINLLSKKFMKENKLYPLRWLFDNKNWDQVESEIVYSQTGSFVNYLISRHGLNRFKKTYMKLSRKNKVEKNIQIIETFYSKSIKQIEENWKDYLKHLNKHNKRIT